MNNNHCLLQGVRNLNIAYQGADEERKADRYLYRGTDLAAVARYHECLGLTVEKPRDLAGAFANALTNNVPVVISVNTEFAYQAPMAWVPE